MIIKDIIKVYRSMISKAITVIHGNNLRENYAQSLEAGKGPIVFFIARNLQ